MTKVLGQAAFRALALCALLLALQPSGRPVSAEDSVVIVAIATNLGKIVVALELGRAPATTRNFLRHVDEDAYEKGSFYRILTPVNQPDDATKIQVVQGGARAKGGIPVRLETTQETGLSHRAGTISMARSRPDTATTEFFICLEDEPELDFGGRRNADGQGFAAFGRVISGMDIVRQIQRLPSKGEQLNPPLEIQSISRVPQGSLVR